MYSTVFRRLVAWAGLATIALAASASAGAQEAGATPEQVEAARALIREGARQIIDEELLLTDDEAEAFWPLYDEYRARIVEVEDRYVAMIREYLTRYLEAKIDDAAADDFLDRYFDIEFDVLKIRKRYVRRFKRILPDVKVMRLYQLENKIQAEIDAALALAIPLADPR